MKKICRFLSFLLLSSLGLNAQAPQMMSFQSVIRNGNNQLLSNAAVGMRISILQGNSSGTVVYAETHNAITNNNGLVTLAVGAGNVQVGSFPAINWGAGPFFIKAETDPTGGNNYSISTTTQLLSVPYALFSGNGLPSGATQGQVITFCDGVPIWTKCGECPGKISQLNCTNATHSGTLTSGTIAASVSSTVPYNGGNGGVYSAQSINSSGVTGLTATLVAGTLAVGSGTLTFNISGTPSSGGTAIFYLTIGNQQCELSRVVADPPFAIGTVHCLGTATVVRDVTNPITGKTWMDRNIGATAVANSRIDASAYGDLFQWGRRADGHQCRSSLTTTTLSSTDQPTHGNFILSGGGNYDWRNPQNDNLWQGVSGPNNPCPLGYRIPANSELDAERLSWSSNNSQGAFTSILKFSASGYRSNYSGGSLAYVGSIGYYWSSGINGTNSSGLYISGNFASINYGNRADAYAVRCIKN